MRTTTACPAQPFRSAGSHRDRSARRAGGDDGRLHRNGGAVGAMRGGGRWLGAAVVLICAGCASSPGQQQAAVPTLGRPAGLFAHGEGFGQVRPSKIFNGGGSPRPLLPYPPPPLGGGARRPVAPGSQQRVTVVAFNRGTCHGRQAYRAVEWYFPAHGGRFNPHRYENICAGAYVPAAP